MRNHLRTLLGIVGALLVFEAAFAQQPVRDSSRAPRVGTASIAGVVVAEEGGELPVARATVRLTGAGLGPGFFTITDDTGRFAFSNLPDGRFSLTVSKERYLRTSYGQRVPGRGTGVPISVQAGQQIIDLQLRLPRGAVITGTVRDARGRPVAHAPIIVLEYRTVNGQRTLWSLGASGWPPTDSLGRFRAYGLPPGTYLVSAYPPGDYRWFPGALIGPFESGGSTSSFAQQEPELREASPAEIQWALQQLQSPGLSSQPTGTSSRTAPAAGPARAPYAATYYPGTTDPASATSISIGRGEERTGVDFFMARQSTARIAGRIVTPAGEPATKVRLTLSAASSASGSTSADGLFSWNNLSPGGYTLLARTADETMWAKREFLISGEDVLDVVLVLEPSQSVTGRVVFAGLTLTPPADLTKVSLALSQQNVLLLRSVAVKPDGSFAIQVTPGEYFVLQPGGGHAWSIGSVVVDGKDLTDLPLRVDSGRNLTGVVVTFTDRLAELSGTLTDTAGQPASGYYVVVFTTDKQHWSRQSRRGPSLVRTATDGAFRVAGLRPGAYHVVAVNEIDQQDLDEVLLSQLAAAATTLTLNDGEKRVQDLKLASGK